MITLLIPRSFDMTGTTPDPIPIPPQPIPDPIPVPPQPVPPIIVPPTPETVGLGNALIGLVLAVVNLVGYVRAWAPETFALANAAVGAFGSVVTIIVRQRVTPMAKIKELAKVLPLLASAYKIKE